MLVCLAIGLVGGVWFVNVTSEGTVCSRGNKVCRYLRIDGKVFVIQDGEQK